MEMSQISGLLIFYHIVCTRSLEASECEVQGSPTVVLEAVQTSARSVEQVISLAPNFRIFCALSGRALCSFFFGVWDGSCSLQISVQLVSDSIGLWTELDKFKF